MTSDKPKKESAKGNKVSKPPVKADNVAGKPEVKTSGEKVKPATA